VTSAIDPGVLRDLAAIIRAADTSDLLSNAGRLAATIVGAHQAAMSHLPDDDGMEPSIAVFLGAGYGITAPFDPRAGIGRFVSIASIAERLTDVELSADVRYHDLLVDARPPLRGFLAAPLLDSQGRAQGRVALSDPVEGDFTEEQGGLLAAVADTVAAALERRRAQERLEEAQLQRQAFFGVVSHELRTPITTIYGGIRMLGQAGARLTHDTREQLLEDITAESERLYRLVEDLLVLSRAERDALRVAAEPILLQHLLARVAASEQQRAPWSRLRVATEPDLPPVMGDSTLIEQVVRNLLSNAVKYAGSHGAVEVTAAAADPWVEVRVSDKGPGIGADSIEHVFELFYRAPDAASRAQGAGIGLYVCNELIRAMGGEMWIRQREPRGVETGFRLRADDEAIID
jgi:K+-sensing histidine kinase KdpD